jgi:hypothetical protein
VNTKSFAASFGLTWTLKAAVCAVAGACMVPALGQPWWDLFLLCLGITAVHAAFQTQASVELS